ncbi:MAG: hypothetical protein HOY78_32395 [Saccharothrix sp.]|nr:hypothetical protein [Saccharothrix sp.]
MRITMMTLAAGPGGALEAGRTYQVPQQVSRRQAQELLDGGYAVEADRDPAARPSATDDPEQVPDKPLAKYTVPELQAYAAGHGIDLGEATRKADVLAAIEAHEQAQDQDDED